MTTNEIAKLIKKSTKTKANIKHLEVLVEMFLRDVAYPESTRYDTYALFTIGLEIQGELIVTHGDFGKHIICYKDELPTYSMLY